LIEGGGGSLSRFSPRQQLFGRRGCPPPGRGSAGVHRVLWEPKDAFAPLKLQDGYPDPHSFGGVGAATFRSRKILWGGGRQERPQESSLTSHRLGGRYFHPLHPALPPIDVHWGRWCVSRRGLPPRFLWPPGPVWGWVSWARQERPRAPQRPHRTSRLPWDRCGRRLMPWTSCTPTQRPTGAGSGTQAKQR